MKPRVIRMREAAAYLGMNKNLFNKEVRPYVISFKIGQQGIGFDCLDLDEWFDNYKAREGKPGSLQLENKSWQKRPQALPREMESGTSTKSSKENDFMKALERTTSKKRSGT